MNPPPTFSELDLKTLFLALYKAGTEQEVEVVIKNHPDVFDNSDNWYPLGGNENTFGVIENQQSSPIASLIEKITNSIDAILMKKCLEAGIDPKSSTAPQSISAAINKFYPKYLNEWSLNTFRKQQAEEIQIIADGTRKDTSVIIYDNGEGQEPDKFESTFLSLLRGNKNEIHFVQGKYNMGGSGAIVFCGKKRYQLIASKRFDGNGKMGFTLIRQHPLSASEQQTKKNTWYEYLKIHGNIPAFDIDYLDLELHNRKFNTGTVIKLYSYQFPSGYSGFAQDLNQSINEFLFEPALPILTVEKEKRYPNNKVLELDLYGLKRRLEKEKPYIEDNFSHEFEDDLFDKMKVTCYIFKSRIKGRNVKDSKQNIKKRFFKNNMSVLFSMNGQVHGHYTSEFITRRLKKNILKDYLLIHVDCTNMRYDFRKELFMASRDRLKDGEATRALRKFLGDKLGAKNSRLSEIEKLRKDSISVSGENTKELLKNFTTNLPLNSDLRKLLGNAFKLDGFPDKQKPDKKKTGKSDKKIRAPFNPKRFPSYLKLKAKNNGETPVAKVPIGGEKTITFETDVEDNYFDRVEDAGELQIALLDFKHNDTTGGTEKGEPKGISEIMNVTKSSPKEGLIKIIFSPKNEVQVGDFIQTKVTLTDQNDSHDQIFWVKIVESNKPQEDTDDKKESDEPLGLPEPVLVYKEEKEGALTWDKLEENSIEMGYDKVMYPMITGEDLEKVYINMDSTILKNFKSKFKTEEALDVADKKYISSVYFHTLFLYTITQKKNYQFSQIRDGQDETVDIGSYLQDLFDSFYSEFILSFGSVDLIASL